MTLIEIEMPKLNLRYDACPTLDTAIIDRQFAPLLVRIHHRTMTLAQTVVSVAWMLDLGTLELTQNPAWLSIETASTIRV